MLVSSSIFAASAVVVVGILILWSNPVRWVNRIVFSCSVHIALWLLARHLTVTAVNGLFWLRWTTAIAAFIPFHFWMVKEAIASDFTDFRGANIWRSTAWIIITAFFACVCFTNFFIPSNSTPEKPLYGAGYYLYIIGSFVMYLILGYDTARRIKSLSGDRRLALQVWLGGGCAAAVSILVLMALNSVIHGVRLIWLRPFLVLIYYTVTAFSITTYRIFDARQILLVAIHKSALIFAVAGAAYLINALVKGFIPDALAFLTAIIFAVWFAAVFDGWLNSLFQFYPQATAARQAAFAVARRESRLENLETAFVSILKGWGQSDNALLVSGGKDGLRGNGIELGIESVEVNALRQLRWVTPERLAREKATTDRIALNDFLEKHNLGALVIGEGPTLTAFIGVGIPASRRPFTFPQITQLMELASIIESALERAHFSVKAQHAEQLATVGLLGASLAHEIRNPLVSIKTFVQLLPTHHQDPAFRAKFFSLIGEEVSRIDRLTEQLLDLASPRAYVSEIIELHPVLRASLDLVVAKATDKRIQFLTDFKASPDQALTDASAAKQVLLNLCFNAIQAVESRPGDRWVKVSTRNVPLGLEMVVEDSGPGIAPEIRSKLFQPFHSTKSTGFGLGLAICSDILGGLNATISVDASAPGQGAVFRVIFPCPVLSSS